jgi:anti-sigma B factor antagonist
MDNDRHLPNGEHEEPEPLRVLVETVVDRRNIGIVRIVGHIEDDTDNRYIHNHVAKLIENGIRNIIIDCSGIQKASPAMIESLAALPRTAKILGGKLAILENKSGIRELFSLFAQDDYFDHFVIKEDIDTAIKYFEGLKDVKHPILNLYAVFKQFFRRRRKLGQENSRIVPGFDDDRDDSLRLRLQKIEDIEGCIVIYMSGWVDLYSSNSFEKRVSKAIDAGYVKLIFQCSGVIFWSSVLIGAFTAFLKRIKPRGGNIVLLEIQPKFYEYLQWLGFSQFFNIKENLDEAVSFFIAYDDEGKESSFPRIFKCPVCSKKLRASKSGRFRCSECKTILAIDNTAQVLLG